MSLTSFVRSPEIIKKILEYYPMPAFGLKGEMLAPPLSKNYALVGTAFDYLLRFYIKKLNPRAVEKEWVAEAAKSLLLSLLPDPREEVPLLLKIETTLKNAKTEYLNFLRSGKITNELLAYTIKLAKLDAIFRAGYIDKQLDYVNQEDVLDLKIFTLQSQTIYL